MFLSSLAHMEQLPRNMVEMIRRLGIEPTREVIDGGRTLRTAAERCLACDAGQECRAWLDTRTESIEAAPSFCPNAVRFQAMRHSH